MRVRTRAEAGQTERHSALFGSSVCSQSGKGAMSDIGQDADCGGDPDPDAGPKPGSGRSGGPDAGATYPPPDGIREAGGVPQGLERSSRVGAASVPLVTSRGQLEGSTAGRRAEGPGRPGVGSERISMRLSTGVPVRVGQSGARPARAAISDSRKRPISAMVRCKKCSA